MGQRSAPFGFCRACGAPLVEKLIEDRPRSVCTACGKIHWRNAKPCAGVLVIRNGKVLLVRRAVPPFQGAWDIPGGFCEAEEHPAETAIREVREETGLEVELTGLLGIWIDRYGEDETLNIFYLARPLNRELRVGDDAGGAAWFSRRALPSRIAFASGIQALRAWAADDSTPLHLRGVGQTEP